VIRPLIGMMHLRPLSGAPVHARSGVSAETVAGLLRVAGGVMAGTALRRDGMTAAPADPGRARAFAAVARR
jgi:predicted TIM-barrel enzyme